MSKITITIEIDETDKEKLSKAIVFLADINGQSEEVAEAKKEAETEEVKSKKETSAKAKKEDPARGAKAKKVEAPEEESEEAEAPAKKSKTNITLDDLRPMITDLVEKHRAALKSKLTELGATSVTTLAEENYEEFYEFMKTL